MKAYARFRWHQILLYIISLVPLGVTYFELVLSANLSRFSDMSHPCAAAMLKVKEIRG